VRELEPEIASSRQRCGRSRVAGAEPRHDDDDEDVERSRALNHVRAIDDSLEQDDDETWDC
jgi:hypothetical protein